MNKNAMKLAIWIKRFKEREELKLTVDEYCERIGMNTASGSASQGRSITTGIRKL